MEVFAPEAQLVREISRAYVEDGCSMRQLALKLSERVPSPNGKPVWSVSMVGRLLRNEAYLGTVYCNRHVAFEGETTRRGVRNRKTSRRERPREEWIPITVPAVVESDLFERAQRVSRDNSKFNPRGAEPGAWLLRGLVECGHCQVGCSSQKKSGRNGRVYRYYYCHNHDPINAGGRDRLCPERHIRADELDAFVFDRVQAALLDPRQLTAGEGAVLTATQPSEDELVAAQLKHLTTALEAADRERTRLLDAYQAGLIDLDQLGRRTQALTARRDQLSQEKDTLSERSNELASQNRLRRGLAHFAKRVAASLDQLDFDARQRLLRLVVEKVRVQGWRVEIHLKIPLPNNDADDNNGGQPPLPTTPPRPSSDVGLRPLDINGQKVARQGRRRLLTQKRPPRQASPVRRGRHTRLGQHAPHRRRRNSDAESFQLANDPPVSPPRVLLREPQDQRANRRFKRRPSRLRSRVPPTASDQPAVPTQQRLRPHREARPPPAATTGSTQQETLDRRASAAAEPTGAAARPTRAAAPRSPDPSTAQAVLPTRSARACPVPRDTQTTKASAPPPTDSTREPNLPTPPPRISVHAFLNPTRTDNRLLAPPRATVNGPRPRPNGRPPGDRHPRLRSPSIRVGAIPPRHPST
jgi:hypothetical protein